MIVEPVSNFAHRERYGNFANMRITNETNFAILRIFVKINFDNFKKSCTFASFLN